VLYVTRLEPENNPDKVIEAYQQVETDIPLVIVGDAPYSSAYKQRLCDLAAKDPRVKLPGAIYGTGYRELISNASIYVQATEVGGTHPALIEAMAVGNCVLANHVPEHEEVLSGSGMLYKKNDLNHLAQCISGLLGDNHKRKELSQLARQRVLSHYDWNAVTDRYVNLFTSMTEGKITPEKTTVNQ
jgi:glycosyltransferase involved in cell wall biosynthesis